MVRLTSLEETLFADDTGEARDRLIAMLASVAARHENRPDTVRFAANAARDVVDTLWARYHGMSADRSEALPRG
ncbi:hypothetical protein [Burkholderia mayonis]|uniref:Uncharacterized protein n=1 Tax=Burkholderia mayonis TaxID=1385591 RepID=A0A1B4FUI5_9BURK|nr:hypothetical protein [Burkholderia mayonis]AOJ07281.1 hypothetical protein WS71_08135 [Burkholderia mayonis]KVE47661.1 hypothetical protein WS71_19045 [Burkholderia mayonis]